MLETSVANRYAHALIDVAAEASAIDAVGADLASFTALLDQDDGVLRASLCTPLFSSAERTDVLVALLPKLKLNPLSANFLQVLNTKRRLPIVDHIAKAYSQLADERAGRVVVRVTTAEKMTATIEREVQVALSKSTGKQVVLQAEVDPELIGGMVVRVSGKVYDSSIRTRLQQVKRQLLENQTPASAK